MNQLSECQDEFLLEVQRLLTHGLPLTAAQSRELFLRATGVKIPVRKWCLACNGTGKTEWMFSHSSDGSATKTRLRCLDCYGIGYIEA